MNFQEGKVSIVMIFLNAGKFIRASIESVIDQTYENWELLLIDDGSTDESTQIALEFANKLPDKIRYLEHENHSNLGMSVTRNLGIQNARGEYFIFLDSDDLFLPTTLEKMVAVFNQSPGIDAVYGNTLYWYSWKHDDSARPTDRNDQVAALSGYANSIAPKANLLKTFIENGDSVPCICSILVKTDFFRRYGIFEDAFTGLYDDQIYYAKIGLHAQAFITDECFAKYRQHPDSCCAESRRIGDQIEKRLLFLKWLRDYLAQQEDADSLICWMVNDEILYHQHPLVHKVKRTVVQTIQSFNLPFFKGLDERSA